MVVSMILFRKEKIFTQYCYKGTKMSQIAGAMFPCSWMCDILMCCSSTSLLTFILPSLCQGGTPI